MSNMEWCILDSEKKEHEAIVKVVSDLNQMGYLISGVCFKNGALEIVCHPPERGERSSEEELQKTLEAGRGTDDAGLSMDGASESFKPDVNKEVIYE
ncbi:MAG: hypothetical protein LBL45_09735 [Treponema sp.]|nr:hypothetical protein [Treponema sp.]